MDLSCFVFVRTRHQSSPSNQINLTDLTIQPDSINRVSTRNLSKLFQLNNSVHPSQPNPINREDHSMEIPLRATIISTLLFIPYITAYMVMGIEIIDPLEKYLFVIILTRIQDTLRNPLIAKFLFNINDLNRQRDALVEREINRQKEIQDALKRRRARQKNKPQRQST